MKSDKYTRMAVASINTSTMDTHWLRSMQDLVCEAIKAGVVLPDSDILLKIGQGIAPNDDFCGFTDPEHAARIQACMYVLTLLYQLAIVKERM